MWSTESLWFEVAVVSIIYALGNILMGQFEEQTPKIRRVGKYVIDTDFSMRDLGFGRQDLRYDFPCIIHYPSHLCARLCFTKEKRHQWLDR